MKLSNLLAIAGVTALAAGIPAAQNEKRGLKDLYGTCDVSSQRCHLESGKTVRCNPRYRLSKYYPKRIPNTCEHDGDICQAHWPYAKAACANVYTKDSRLPKKDVSLPAGNPVTRNEKRRGPNSHNLPAETSDETTAQDQRLRQVSRVSSATSNKSPL